MRLKVVCAGLLCLLAELGLLLIFDAKLSLCTEMRDTSASQ